MNAFCRKANRRPRRGAVAVLAAVLLVVVVGVIAFALDLGYISLVRTQLQNTADVAAMAAAAYIPDDMELATQEAQRFAGYQTVAGSHCAAESVAVEFGTWDPGSKTFTSSPTPGNAVRVGVERTARRGGPVRLFFAPIFGMSAFECSASAIAMTNPRDIAFVVDLSGSMNNDTEPCWATSEVDIAFAPEGYPTIGEELMQQLYSDFGYGTFPGTLQYVGQPLGVAQDEYAYAEMTKNSGPLTPTSIPSTYRISSGNSESTRKQKAYKWIIDNQLAVLMPNARPTPNSGNSASYAYWEKYLDYIMKSRQITSSSPKGRPRPSYPVTLPPSQSSNRISGYANPYYDAFPEADGNTPLNYRNLLGYRTYVQFMMDFGRDRQPVSGQYTPLSRLSPLCPWHNEETDGGTFSFPPREQPTHAARRALIAAIEVIKQRNLGISDSNQRDWVSLITFDRASGVVIEQSLTSEYETAMQACTTLQAVADDASSTATESGLIAAKNHIASPDDGGAGRRYTNKVVVLLTDGIPNLHSSSSGEINNFISVNPSGDFYGGSEYDKNAALMQCMTMQLQRWQVFPVGVGLGTQYEFMDRCARLGATANEDGQGPRGTGNPAQYEQRLKDIFEGIIANPRARLVQ